MLCRKNSTRERGGSIPVYLNVYDLTSYNGYAYWLGLGVYHSGVQGNSNHLYIETSIFICICVMCMPVSW